MLMQQLKKIGVNIHQWNKDLFGITHSQKTDLIISIDELDEKEQELGLSGAERDLRRNFKARLAEMTLREERRLMQKCKTKWSFEGMRIGHFFTIWQTLKGIRT